MDVQNGVYGAWTGRQIFQPFSGAGDVRLSSVFSQLERACSHQTVTCSSGTLVQHRARTLTSVTNIWRLSNSTKLGFFSDPAAPAAAPTDFASIMPRNGTRTGTTASPAIGASAATFDSFDYQLRHGITAWLLPVIGALALAMLGVITFCVWHEQIVAFLRLGGHAGLRIASISVLALAGFIGTMGTVHAGTGGLLDVQSGTNLTWFALALVVLAALVAWVTGVATYRRSQ